MNGILIVLIIFSFCSLSRVFKPLFTTFMSPMVFIPRVLSHLLQGIYVHLEALFRAHVHLATGTQAR